MISTVSGTVLGLRTVPQAQNSTAAAQKQYRRGRAFQNQQILQIWPRQPPRSMCCDPRHAISKQFKASMEAEK